MRKLCGSRTGKDWLQLMCCALISRWFLILEIEGIGEQRLSRKTKVDIQTEVTDRSTKVYIHKGCFNRNRRWMQGMMENVWNEKNTCAQE